MLSAYRSLIRSRTKSDQNNCISTNDSEKVLPIKRRRPVSTAYEYTHLDPGSIRLLVLSPDLDDHGEISTHMETVWLEPRAVKVKDGWVRQKPVIPKYTALSHVWGPSLPNRSHLSHSIVCGGCRIQVTSRIHTALMHIRQQLSWNMQVTEKTGAHDNQELRLWIDSICVNQENRLERAQQIGNMDQIYRKSDNLLIWLGDFEAHSEGLFERDMCTKVFGRYRMPDYGAPSISSEYSEQDHRRALTESPRESEEIRRFLKSLLQRPWFKRRWVIQEYMLGPRQRRCVQLGHIVISATTLRLALEIYHLLDEAGPFRLLPDEQPRLNLLQNMYIHHAAQCTVPHDRAIALLGLSTDGHAHPINYEQPIRYMCMAIARRAVLDVSRSIESFGESGLAETIQTLSLVACATARPNADVSDWPSWLPDWEMDPIFVSPEHKACVDLTMIPKLRIMKHHDIDDTPFDRSNMHLFRKARTIYNHLRPDIDVAAGLLSLAGLLLKTCFPPKHATKSSPNEVCKCCQHCSWLWNNRWSDRHKSMLGRVSTHSGWMLFYPLESRILFVIRRVTHLSAQPAPETASKLFKVIFCFSVPRGSSKHPHDRVSRITLL